MNRRFRPSSDHRELIDAFVASYTAAGRSPASSIDAIKAFCRNVGTAAAWEALNIDAQLALGRNERRVAMWLLATGRARTTAEYLLRADIFMGHAFATVYGSSMKRFCEQALALGESPTVARKSWKGLCLVAALNAVAPGEVTASMIDTARSDVMTTVRRLGFHVQAGHMISAEMFRAHTILFHIGQVDVTPRKGVGYKLRRRDWTGVAPGLAAPFQRYLSQVRLIRRPATVDQTEGFLREFAWWLTRSHPDVTRLSLIERHHLEAFHQWLAIRPTKRRDHGPLPPASRAKRLAILRSCFEKMADWDYPDHPRPRLVIDDDFPIPDHPLPRFIDDPSAAKLVVAARASQVSFDRICVEFLARTGLRVGEFLDLTIDAVVQIGSAFWLRVPLGKLHNDRYIPLHPDLKTMLDRWLNDRPDALRGNWLWMIRGRRATRSHVTLALNRVTTDAGIDRVTAHQLRHTLATQAINRGMSLEALAALLGHKTLAMTLVYARIADRTVADEYANVTSKIEALYDNATNQRLLPADAEGAEMRKIRNEAHRRMLGNGWCARPVELDCRFETVCETCTYFVTTVEFLPTIRRQRDDAHDKGQLARRDLYDSIINRLDTA